MWDDLLFAVRWSFRELAIATWLLVMIGAMIGWLYRWIMDDSR
jgi:hypothetical protein